MSEMRDRIARVLRWASHGVPKDEPIEGTIWQEHANQVLEELRHPTEAMIEAGGNTEHLNSAPDEVWEQMIEEAIELRRRP